MYYKFKFFSDERSGVPNSVEINKWLKNHPFIKIKHIYGQSDAVYIFYKEKFIKE